jgi:hypothetical protein
MALSAPHSNSDCGHSPPVRSEKKREWEEEEFRGRKCDPVYEEVKRCQGETKLDVKNRPGEMPGAISRECLAKANESKISG